MNIAIVGHTGFIGAPIADEALSRGHTVTGLSRNPGEARPGLNPVTADSHDPAALAQALKGADVAVIAVRWNENDASDLIAALRSAGVPRAVFVVGAGSLVEPDGRLWLEHMIEQGIAPPTSRSAMEALGTIRAVTDLDWVAVSPAKDIDPGARTGIFTLGTDSAVLDAEGNSRISTEDFAVAILNEIETPSKSRERFTVGYTA